MKSTKLKRILGLFFTLAVVGVLVTSCEKESIVADDENLASLSKYDSILDIGTVEYDEKGNYTFSVDAEYLDIIWEKYNLELDADAEKLLSELDSEIEEKYGKISYLKRGQYYGQAMVITQCHFYVASGAGGSVSDCCDTSGFTYARAWTKQNNATCGFDFDVNHNGTCAFAYADGITCTVNASTL